MVGSGAVAMHEQFAAVAVSEGMPGYSLVGEVIVEIFDAYIFYLFKFHIDFNQGNLSNQNT